MIGMTLHVYIIKYMYCIQVHVHVLYIHVCISLIQVVVVHVYKYMHIYCTCNVYTYSTEQMQVKTHSRAPLECAFITLEYFIRTRDYRFMYTRAHASVCVLDSRPSVIVRARVRVRVIVFWAGLFGSRV